MKKQIFIFICLILNLICLYPFTKVFSYRFLIDGLLFFTIGVFLLKKNPFENKVFGMLLIFMPFIFLQIIVALENAITTMTFAGIPLLFVSLLSFLLSKYVYKKNNNLIIGLGFSYLFFLIITSLFLQNYYNFITHHESEFVSKTLPDVFLYDDKGTIVNRQKLIGKISVIDVWDSRCSNCIKDFPKFEKVKNEFKNQKDVNFYTLNLPLKGDERERVSKFTKEFSFEKLYADNSLKNKLKINGVPQYIILDKDLKIIYIGNLITGRFEIYNNFYSIIKKIND